MKYRLAKLCDLREIVNIHFVIRDSYPVGIFAQLGKQFLIQYYKIILNDKNAIVVCAEDEHGKIQGFCSATLDVKKQFANLRHHNIALGLSAISSILFKPSLIKSLILRYKSTKEGGDSQFISATGARGEYWAWSLSTKDSISSLEMHETQLNILRDLGVKELNIEVDTINKNIFLFHKCNGAKLVKKILLPDGRERAMMIYNLVDRKSKI